MGSFLRTSSCRILTFQSMSARSGFTLLRSQPCTQELRFGHCSVVAMSKYYWAGEVERLEAYRSGGYHPVMIGAGTPTLYTVIDKLGFGGFSTVWLVRDCHTDKFVALKIGISCVSSARHEYQILDILSKSPASTTSVVQAKTESRAPIPSVLDRFEVQGPNGLHRCYTMDLMQGDLRAASYSRLFPIRVARALAARLVLAVDHVHSRGYVHGGGYYSLVCKDTLKTNIFSQTFDSAMC